LEKVVANATGGADTVAAVTLTFTAAAAAATEAADRESSENVTDMALPEALAWPKPAALASPNGEIGEAPVIESL